MHGGQIAEGERWAEGDAWAGVGARHHRIHIVTDRIQTANRLALLVDDLRVGGSDQPA